MPHLFIATRKGAFIARSSDRAEWTLDGPHFLGHQCHHMVLDPRDRRTLLVCAHAYHLGPTIFRSEDFGASWKEVETPPKFPSTDARRRAVHHVFWLTPGHPEQPGVWYAGTSPQALFRSDDGGRNWAPISGFNEHPKNLAWVGDDKSGTPDGAQLHSICVDPQDPARLYVGMSSGGVFESRDAGATWRPLNDGLETVFPPQDPAENFGHDPHCVVQHPADPDRLWQQNHCGIYRLDRPSEVWRRVGKNMPAEIGDIGFPIVVHPRDPQTAWVMPMDGTDVWPRTSPGGRPAVYVTRDGGESWQRQDRGMPAAHAYWTVKRQAMCADDGVPLGLYLGTTNGEVWASADEGESFTCILRHLPHVFALSTAP